MRMRMTTIGAYTADPPLLNVPALSPALCAPGSTPSFAMSQRRLILDGSMGHTLKQRGLSDSFAEAAFANLRQPELVTSVHSEVSAAPSESGSDTPLSPQSCCAVRGSRRRRSDH